MIPPMTALEVAQKVAAEKQAHLFRERKDAPGQYDAKPYGGGSSRGWVILDSYSASAILAVYNALKPENQAKYAAMSLQKMAVVAFKMLQGPSSK